MIKKIFSILVLALLMSFGLSAQSFDAKAVLKPRTGVQTLVNDFTNTLTLDQKTTLEQKLVRLDDSTSTQVAVVIVPNTGGMDVADYATELGRNWGVGGKEFNNGVVLLISKDTRKLNISPGYGLEGSLTDVMASHIIQDIIVPNFKGNDYYRGIEEGTDAIIDAVQNKYQVPRNYDEGGGMSLFTILLILFVAIIIISIISKGGGGNNDGGQWMSRRGSRGFDGPIILPGGWGGGFGGSGGGFGGGGGGFGGFGGGSFGGGGASGSW